MLKAFFHFILFKLCKNNQKNNNRTFQPIKLKSNFCKNVIWNLLLSVQGEHIQVLLPHKNQKYKTFFQANNGQQGAKTILKHFFSGGGYMNALDRASKMLRVVKKHLHYKNWSRNQLIIYTNDSLAI